MSQTTRCPSCNACFKIVADQLRISDGWVRCGECSQVFDASRSLEPAEPPALLPDLNLENLRGPVERAKPAPPPPVAWHAPPADADTWALRTARLAQNAPPALQIGAGTSVTSQKWQPITSTSLLSQPPSTALPSNAEAAPHPTRVSDPDVKVSTAPWQFADASDFDTTVPAALTESQEPDIDPSPLPSEPSPDAAGLPGYELPGALSDDEEDSEFLVPLLPEAPPAELVEVPAPVAPQWFDHEIPDFTSFRADFAQELDSHSADLKEPDAASTREETAELVQAGKGIQSSVDYQVPQQTAPEPNACPKLGGHAELEQRAHEPVFPVPERVPAPVDDSLAYDELHQDVPDLSEDAGARQSVFSDYDDEPSFVRHARHRAFWHGSRVRTRLWLAALVLLLVLAGQMTLQHRDQLAARIPQTRAALVSTCEVLGCVVGAHRDIAAILIEGSSFNRVQGDEYTFLLTLRNRSAQEVRAPLIELTLMDVQDQPVLRRVLAAAELNLPNVLQPQQEWSGEIPMAIATGTARIAGFRALAFYPN